MSERPEELVALRGVSKAYGVEPVTYALREVDLTVSVGEFCAIIGPSGSGKSTLLNILGLLERPTAGSVRIAGRETTTLDERALTQMRGSHIGFVFQFHHLLPEFSAEENVAMPLALAAGALRRDMRARANALLDRVGLRDKATSRTNTLSGGQQQRVAIARALAQSPPLVLADEPTGNLDTRASDAIFALLREINQAERTTFLIVTHDPRLAARCDRTVQIVDGRIVADTTSPSGSA